jgi:hypothetical protein
MILSKLFLSCNSSGTNTQVDGKMLSLYQASKVKHNFNRSSGNWERSIQSRAKYKKPNLIITSPLQSKINFSLAIKDFHLICCRTAAAAQNCEAKVEEAATTCCFPLLLHGKLFELVFVLVLCPGLRLQTVACLL